MKIRIKFSVQIGDDEPRPSEHERYVDALGSHHDAGYTDTHLGFIAPANYEQEPT